MRWKTDTYAGWGRALKAEGQIGRPERIADIDGLAPACGNRRSYGDAALNDGGQIVDMTRMDRLLSFDAAKGEVEVEAGCTIATLARVFVRKGWLPTVMPGTGFATVGGCIGMDVHGKNHHGVGSFGQHVKAITLRTPDGIRTITPADQGIWAATIGGLGQTGVILSARLALTRVKGEVMSVTERRAEGFDEHIALLDRSTATYCVGWIDATATGDNLGRGILEEAEVAGGLVPAPKPSKKVPFDAPDFALSGPVVRMFNAAYYGRVPVSGRTTIKPIDDFFFPLDRIHDWNRLYGKRGFFQFQCVVPEAQKDILRDILRSIAMARLASPLAVLKRMGEGRGGMMSFPMEGYTLAVDFPNSEPAQDLVKRLTQLTADAQGRVYLAKDGLASGAQIRTMYPEWSDWRDVVNAIDPEHRLETDMTRRLSLRSEK